MSKPPSSGSIISVVPCEATSQPAMPSQRSSVPSDASKASAPNGGITFYRDGSKGSTLEDPTILEIAAAHRRTPAQVMLRWHLQEGRQPIPKSVTPSRIAENFAVFDFELTGEQLAAIDALETGIRGGPAPETITRGFGSIEIPEA